MPSSLRYLCVQLTHGSLLKLWGGKLDSMITEETGITTHNGFPTNIAATREWPVAMCRPRPYHRRGTATRDEQENGWPVWLTDPPPSVVGRDTALPVTMLSRYHDQRFWSAEFRKYGHQALKLSRHRWEGRPLKSHFKYMLVSRRDVVRAFGSTRAFRWMKSARETLVAAREYALAAYMMNLARNVVESDMMRRRLHYEKKAWPRTDAKLTRLRREVNRIRGITTARLDDYMAMRSVLPLDTEEVGRDLEEYLTQTRQLLIQCKDLNRLLGEEVQYLQYLVLGVLKQEENSRTRLQSYMDVISERINRVLEPAANTIIRMASVINAEWPGVVTEYTDACLAQDIHVDENVSNLWDTISAMSSDSNALFPSIRQHLSNLRDIILNGRAVAAHRLAGEPLSGNFDLLVDSNGLREIRTQRMQLRNLALRDMRRLSHVSNLREIVMEWLALLATHDRLRGAATREERRAIRGDAPLSFSELPGLAGNMDWDDDESF